jgi:hypothetical protein
MYNLNNEPCFKYSLFFFIDSYINFKNSLISNKLENEIFYFEDDNLRYELCKISNRNINNNFEYKIGLYRFSKVKNPFNIDIDIYPLDDSDIEIFYNKIQWDDIQFGLEEIQIKNQKFIIKKYFTVKL